MAPNLSLFLRIGDFCVLWELIFAIRTDWFFSLGSNFCDFQKVPSTQYPALIIFSFLLSTCNRNTYFQTINQYFIVHLFVCEWNRQVVIEQTRFLSTVFLCCEFKLADIYSGVNFLGKNACANFFFFGRETKFLRIGEKIAKSQNRKN